MAGAFDDLIPVAAPPAQAPAPSVQQPPPPSQGDQLATMRLLAGTVTAPNEPDVYRDPHTGAVLATGPIGVTADGSADFSQIKAAQSNGGAQPGTAQQPAAEPPATTTNGQATTAASGSPFDDLIPTAGYQKAMAEQRASDDPTVEGVGDAILNGLSFNRADAVKGAMAYLGAAGRNLIGDHSISPSEAFEAEQDLTREQGADFASKHPLSNFALNLAGGVPIGEGAGAMVGRGASLVSSAASSAPAWLAKGAAAIPVAAALGGAYGSGADKADPTTGGIHGAEIGGALGVAAPIVGAGAGLLANAGKEAAGGIAAAIQDAARGASPTLTPQEAASTQAAAARYLQGKLASAGMTPADVSASPLAARGGTVAEALGPDAVADAASIVRRPGAGAQLSRDTLQPRAEGRTSRILNDVASITGVDPVAAQQGVEGVVQAGQAKAAPLYDAVRQDGTRYMTRDMRQVLQTPAGQDALAATHRDLLNAVPAGGPAPADVGITLDGNGKPMVAKGLRPVAIDMVKRNLDDATKFQPFGGAQTGNANKAVDAARDAWVTSARQAVPGYAQALDSGGDYKALQGAYKAAQGKLFGAGSGNSVQDVTNIWGKLGSDAERDAVRSRFAADIMDKANAGTLTPGQLQKPGVYQKLGLVFGQDKADALVQAASHEASLSASGSRLMPGTGSITADALNHGDAQDAAMDTLRAGMHAVHRLKEGKPIAAAIAGITHMAEKSGAAIKTPYNQATRDALARLYLGDASDFESTFKPAAGGSSATPYLDAGGALASRILPTAARVIPTMTERRSGSGR